MSRVGRLVLVALIQGGGPAGEKGQSVLAYQLSLSLPQTKCRLMPLRSSSAR